MSAPSPRYRAHVRGLLVPYLLGWGTGCGAAATYRLPPATGSSLQQVGELSIDAITDVHNIPSQGWDLQVQLTFDWRGQERSRVDLTRARVRVDSSAWRPCRPPADADRDHLLLLLEPGAHTTTTLTCIDIPKPATLLELSIPATGSGAPRGTVDFSFDGVG